MNMLQKLKPKELYVRVFMLLAVMFTIIIIVFSTVLTQTIKNNAMNEVDEFSRQRIDQIVYSTEYALQKLKLYSLRMYGDTSLGGWTAQKEEDVPRLQNMITSLRDYVTIETFIHEIYLVNTNLNQVYSSVSGIWKTSVFFDQDMLNLLKYDRPRNLMFFKYNRGKEAFLAVIVSNSQRNWDSNGYLVMLIDTKLLQENIMQVNADTLSKIVVFDQQGNSILGDTDSELAVELSHLNVQDKFGRFRWSIKGTEWSIRYAAMNTVSWTVFHLTPMEIMKRNINQIQWIMISSFVMLLMVILFILFWNSRRNVKPFSDLVQKVQSRLGLEIAEMNKANNASEAMQNIDSGIDTLVSKVAKLDQAVKDQKSLVKEELLRQWVLSGSLTISIRAHLLEESQLLNQGKLRLVVLRIEEYATFTADYDFKSRKLLKYAMANIAQEVISKYGGNSETIDFGTDHIVILLSTAAELTDWHHILLEVKAEIAKWLRIPIVVAISEERTLEQPLSELYQQILEITTLKFIEGEDRIYVELDWKTNSDRMEKSVLDKDIMSELIRSVRLRNEAAVTAYLDELMAKMKGMTYSECKLQLTQLIYVLTKAFKLLESSQGMNGIHELLNQFSSLNSARSWLETQLSNLMKDLSRRSSSNRKEEIATEAVEFVRGNLLNPMLTIEDIADHSSVSVSYVRQIFKELFQCTVSEFVMDQRISNVMQMLTSTGLTIADIAEQSGFQTKSHFFTAFKKATGMTPNQYRQENQS